MSQESNTRSSSTVGGSISRTEYFGSQSRSGDEWIPLAHDDAAGPRTQARRETPPSSQQYSRWTPDDRQVYRSELISEHSSRRDTEIEVLRQSVSWHRQESERLRESIGCHHLGINGLPEPEPESNPVDETPRPARVTGWNPSIRVAAMRDLGSQGSSIRTLTQESRYPSQGSSEETMTQESHNSSQEGSGQGTGQLYVYPSCPRRY